jgi:uncharacterized protein with PQ loop repeat
VYFSIIDTILCFQYLYYVKFSDNRLKRWIHSRNGEEVKLSNSADEVSSLSEQTPLLSASPDNQKNPGSSSYKTTTSLMMMGLFSFYYTFSSSSTLTTLTTTTLSDTGSYDITSTMNEDPQVLWIGRFFAWLCTFLYLSSRLPQIIKNFQRRSVQGLSMALFFFAACGNMTYVLSIFTNPHATRKVMLEAVPYLIGSAGTLCFDATIFGQYLVYNNSQEEKVDVEHLPIMRRDENEVVHI